MIFNLSAPVLQIGGLLVLLFFTHYTFAQYRRKTFNFIDFIGWTTIWVSLILMVIFPEILQPLVQEGFLFWRVLDIVLVTAIATLLMATFYTYRKLRIVEEKMKKLVKAYAERDD